MANDTQVAPNRAITVPFHGADLYVVEHNGQPFTPMKALVTAMGLNWSGQFEKVKENESRWGIRNIRIPSDGGVQEAIGLPLRKLPGWMATLEPKKMKSPETAARVIQYQNECDDVLWQYWNDGIVINPRAAYSVNPDQTLSAEQAETLRLLLTENVKRLPKAKQGWAMVKGWSKLKAHFKTDYRHIPAGEFHEAVSIIARHTAEFAEWELVDEAPKLGHQKTVNEIVADWVKKIEEPNGHPAVLFMPLVNAVLRKQGFNLALSAGPASGLLPEAQAKEITERLDRLGKLFNPLSQPFNDVMGVLRALRGLHPVAPMPEPGYRQLLPRLA